MANDSMQAPPTSVELFDQDSVQGSFATALEDGHEGICQECHVGNCGRCADPECNCPHPFAVIGRAIVELDGSLQRTNELLKKLERSFTTTEQVVPTGSDEPTPVAPLPNVPAKARRGLGRKKSLR